MQPPPPVSRIRVLTSLTYVDVGRPQRPAVGGSPGPVPATTPVTAAPTTVAGMP